VIVVKPVPLITELFPLPPALVPEYVPAIPPAPTVTVYVVRVDNVAVAANKPPAPPPPPEAAPPPAPPATTR
jgi:hypothetical protein